MSSGTWIPCLRESSPSASVSRQSSPHPNPLPEGEGTGQMPINVDRISRDIEAIAGFNEASPTVGFSRPTFSPAWRAARDYVIAQAEAAGCVTRIDAAGNVHARPRDLA